MLLTIAQAMIRVREFSRTPSTRAGLVYIGERERFCTKAEDGIHYIFDEQEMVKYFSSLEGKFTIVEAAKKLGIPKSRIYYLCLKYNLPSKGLFDAQALQSIRKLNQKPPRKSIR